MVDDSELDYMRTFLEAVHKGTYNWTDYIASAVVATKVITLTAQAGTLNQWAGYCIWVYSGTNAGNEYHIVSNTNATPTLLTVSEAVTVDLAADVVYCYTGATAKQFSEVKNIAQIDDLHRMLVYPPELLGSDGDDFYWKRYKIVISETDEANMMIALNNIILGIKKFDKRTITNYTRPTTMCHMKLVNSNAAFEDPTSKRWDCLIYIDVEWSTS